MTSASQTPAPSCFLFLVLAAALLFPPLLADAAGRPLDLDGSSNRLGRKVGGRMDVAGVDRNEEVQALGRFAVEEHNRRVLPSSAEHLLAFCRVERAQSQVVAGIKYYLTVAVAGGAGRYNAEIVVRAWENKRELLSFTPAAADDAGSHLGIVNGGCGASRSKVQ